jgi:Ni/Co efflux regulator RcnB
MKLMICIAAAACLASPAAAAAQGRSNTRFEGMDTNRDGVITRNEWRGNDRSFRNHDWNGDGRLTGDEIRVGAQRANDWDDRDIEASIARENDWTPERFRVLDHIGDGRLARNEGHAAP